LSGQLPEMTTEVLSVKDTFNELLLTRLRTVNGLNRKQLLNFPITFIDHFDALFPDFNKRGLIEYNQSNYVLTIEGQMLSDYIISSLFVTD
jgi:coproporphyrinogen III oxidase-like Fe-S oxidoreductase